MLFNSAVFLVFVAIFFWLWPSARRRPNVRYSYLVATAAVFYGWWDWRFLFLLFVPGIVDFALVRAMATAGPRARDALFAASLTLNLGSLVVFKYSGWFIELLTGALTAVGVGTDMRAAVPSAFLLLPIGVSFYTFQALTYTIEVHNGRLQPTHNILHYLAFKSLFPLLLAGPIMRADQLLPQLAASLTDFWSRWHISLSGWIWRYLFTPLTYRTLRLVGRLHLPTVEKEMRLAYPTAAIVSMFLCGLWHGAGLTFVVWGLLHGVLLSWERLTNLPKRLKRLPGGRNLAMALTALQVGLTWVLFRATDLEQAVTILRRLFSFSGGIAPALREGFGGYATLNISILLGFAIAREAWHHFGIEARLPLPIAARRRCEMAAVALLIPLSIFLRGPGTRFIYFQF